MKKVVVSENTIHNLIENYELEIQPNDIDTSSFIVKKNLNKHIWNGNFINSKIRLKLLDISDDFIEWIGISNIKPIDIVLTGSICNFNWSQYSDIDLHIILNFSELSDDVDLLRDYFNAKKNIWNDEHDLLEIYGFKVEIYVEDVNDLTNSDGIYSLAKNKWIKKPILNKSYMLTKNKDEIVKQISAEIITKIDDLNELINTEDDIATLEKFGNQISNMLFKIKMYRQDSLNRKGEMSVGNLVYKVLRRTEYLDKLWKLKNFIYDKINSINS